MSDHAQTVVGIKTEPLDILFATLEERVNFEGEGHLGALKLAFQLVAEQRDLFRFIEREREHKIVSVQAQPPGVPEPEAKFLTPLIAALKEEAYGCLDGVDGQLTSAFEEVMADSELLRLLEQARARVVSTRSAYLAM